MTTGHARTHGPQTETRPPSSWGGGSVARGTLGWYGDASGGFFLETLEEVELASCVPGLSKDYVQFPNRLL